VEDKMKKNYRGQLLSLDKRLSAKRNKKHKTKIEKRRKERNK